MGKRGEALPVGIPLGVGSTFCGAGSVTTVGEALQAAHAYLDSAQVPESRRTAEWLLEALTGTGRALLYAFPERPLGQADAARLKSWLARRAAGEPVQYILGVADFWGLRLQVTPAVLIPRPETEEVVEHALAQIAAVPHPRVLDAGTGSGCIALAIKQARPDAEVHALDNSEAALDVARANAREHGLAITFHYASLLAAKLPEVPVSLDLLVSNPPYIPDREAGMLERHVRDFEPAAALFSGDDALVFYRALARHALQHVQPGGKVVVETHADYAGRVARCFSLPAYEKKTVLRDLAQRPRIVIAQRT